jgi:hypothetical protein
MCYMPCPHHPAWFEHPKHYLASNNEALHYAVFPASCYFALLIPSIFLRTVSVYDLPLAWQTEFHAHTKQELCTVNYYNYAETLHV